MPAFLSSPESKEERRNSVPSYRHFSPLRSVLENLTRKSNKNILLPPVEIAKYAFHESKRTY
jgi:hypothetical protein